MKVLVVGAGAVGSVISKFLATDEKISEIICATRHIQRAREFLDLKESKIKLIKLDASNIKQIIKVAKQTDLIINASLPQFNENIMEASLAVGANYQDLCSYLVDFKNPEQLKFHQRFKKAKLIGLINTGISPGITNLVAREVADKFDSILEIKIRLIEEQKTSELIFAWSPEVALDELTSPPLVYANGRFRLCKPFGDIEEFDFPEPFSKKYVVSIYGDEVATIPLYIKTRNVNYKSCGTDIEFSKALYRLGLFNKRPIVLGGKKIIPFELFSKIINPVPTPKKMLDLIESGIIENAYLLLVVEVVGWESGKKIKIRSAITFPDLRKVSQLLPGATYISYPTGISAAIFSKIIPKINTFGVFPPEALGCEIRKEILIELENRGVIIEEQFSKAN
jgi:saccharopine dehydrogenase-like NADP-dependent oxidoreductase